MREWLFLITVIVSLGALAIANAEERVYTVKDVMTGEAPDLIGGVIADPAEFPASVWIGNCTGTVAGERVLLTAAHCVSNGGTKSFSVGTTKYNARCSHHPSYRGNSTADWAICLVDKKVEGIAYEQVAKEKEYEIESEILLSGYGCRIWGGGLDGKYRIGRAPVIRLPSGSNFDTVTRGKSALCSGDSGGPAWFVKPSGERKLIGVNSRSNTTTTSYLSSHWVETAQSFYKNWAQSNAVKICGIHEDALGCRFVTPPIPNHFEVDGRVAKASVTLKSGFEELLEKLKVEIQKILE